MNFSGIGSLSRIREVQEDVSLRSLPAAQQVSLWLAIKSEEEGKRLLEKGLDVNVLHCYGTPLMYFVAKFTDINGVLQEPVFTENHRRTLEALLFCGADPTLSCWFLPESCLSALELNQHPEIQKILEKHLNPQKG